MIRGIKSISGADDFGSPTLRRGVFERSSAGHTRRRRARLTAYTFHSSFSFITGLSRPGTSYLTRGALAGRVRAAPPFESHGTNIPAEELHAIKLVPKDTRVSGLGNETPSEFPRDKTA